MRVQRLLILICALFLFIVYVACQRDDYGPLPTPDPGTPGVQVKSSVEGRVLDDQQVPVQGAIVKAGSSTAFTDLNGNFQIKNVSLDENAGFVKVEKTGFFTGSRTFKVIEGSKHFVSVQLIKKNDAGNFNGTAGGTITVPNGGSIVFEAASVIDPVTKVAYTGTVSVSAFLIDPTADNFREMMPGELRGIDENNRQVGLQSFGMMAVEMTGAAGEKLQLAPGKPATINFPIPSDLQASAAATIAFWSFNDTTGLWKQEGTATRKGNEYCGKTSHFSFWNCDAPFPLVQFRATLKDQGGNPIKFIRVLIKTSDNENGPAAYAYTDSAGVISGLVPSGRPLTLSVFSNCNDELVRKNIGPFSSKTDLGDISITVPADSRATITGEIQDCSGAPLQNGYADINLSGAIERAPILNGVLNYSFIHCGSNIAKASIRITDVGNSIISGIKEVDVISNTGNLGQLKICEEDLTEYLIYKMDTIDETFLPPADQPRLDAYQGKLYLLFAKKDTSNDFRLVITPDPTGTVFTADNLLLAEREDNYYNEGVITLDITEYTGSDYMAGTFSANMKSPTNALIPINGRFRLKRPK